MIGEPAAVCGLGKWPKVMRLPMMGQDDFLIQVGQRGIQRSSLLAWRIAAHSASTSSMVL